MDTSQSRNYLKGGDLMSSEISTVSMKPASLDWMMEVPSIF